MAEIYDHGIYYKTADPEGGVVQLDRVTPEWLAQERSFERRELRIIEALLMEASDNVRRALYNSPVVPARQDDLV